MHQEDFFFSAFAARFSFKVFEGAFFASRFWFIPLLMADSRSNSWNNVTIA